MAAVELKRNIRPVLNKKVSDIMNVYSRRHEGSLTLSAQNGDIVMC